MEAKFILWTSVSTIKSTIFKPELYWCFKPELYRRIVKILYFVSLDMLIPVYFTQYIYFLLTMIKKHPDDVKMHAWNKYTYLQNPDSYRRFKSKLYRRNVKILYLLSLYMLEPVHFKQYIDSLQNMLKSIQVGVK